MLTIKALWLVNAEQLAALGAFPPLFFVFNEFPHAHFFDVLKIINHAHAILGPVPFIQIFQPGARGAIANKAVFFFRTRYLLAFLDPA